MDTIVIIIIVVVGGAIVQHMIKTGKIKPGSRRKKNDEE